MPGPPRRPRRGPLAGAPPRSFELLGQGVGEGGDVVDEDARVTEPASPLLVPVAVAVPRVDFRAAVVRDASVTFTRGSSSFWTSAPANAMDETLLGNAPPRPGRRRRQVNAPSRTRAGAARRPPGSRASREERGPPATVPGRGGGGLGGSRGDHLVGSGALPEPLRLPGQCRGNAGPGPRSVGRCVWGSSAGAMPCGALGVACIFS